MIIKNRCLLFILNLFILNQPIAFVVQGTDVFDLDPYEVRPTRLGLEDHRQNKMTSFEVNNSSIASSFNMNEGMFFYQNGGSGGSVELLVRGAEPNFTKVYVEGIEVNDSTDIRGSGYQFTQLSPSMYGRIDLIRGSHSAVLGSGSMAGVVSVSLPMQTEQGSSLTLFGTNGSYGYEERGVNWGSREQQSSVSFQYAEVAEDDRFDGSNYENTSIVLKGDYRISDRDLLKIAYWSGDTERNQYPDDSGGPLYAEMKAVDVYESKDMGISFRHQRQLSEALEWMNSIGYYENDSLINSPGVMPSAANPMGVPPNRYDNLFKRYQAESYLVKSFDQWQLAGGLSAKSESGISDGLNIFPFAEIPAFYDKKRWAIAGYVESLFKLGKSQEVQLAVRADKVKDFDIEWSPSLQYRFKLDSLQSTIQASYDRGFKVPDFFALYNSLVGNEDIKPEFVDSYELGISTAFSEKWNLGLTVFHQDYKDLIDMSEVSFSLMNLSGVSIQGFEMSLNWIYSDNFQMRIYSTHLNIDLDSPGEILRHRPDWMAGLAAEWSISDDSTLLMHYSYTDERWDSSIPTGSIRLEQFSHFDLIYHYQLTEDIELSAGAYNLFDQQKELSIGYKERGRDYRFSVKATF